MVKVPLIVDADPKLTPPAMLTLLKPIVPETVPVPEKVNVPAPVPEANNPEDWVMDPLFETVIVLPLPTVKVPEVRISVPANDALLVSVTPATLLIVRLFAPVKPSPVDCALLPLNV